MVISAGGSAAAGEGAVPAVTTSGCIMPFITCGTPSRLGIQHTRTYDPGSSIWVATPVSPSVTALGPPGNVIQDGGGAWLFIAAASPAWKSAALLPSPSRTREAWCSSFPWLTRRKVVRPAGLAAGRPHARPGAGAGDPPRAAALRRRPAPPAAPA